MSTSEKRDRHAWHIDSTGLRGSLQPRTDIRAKETWSTILEQDW